MTTHDNKVGIRHSYQFSGGRHFFNFFLPRTESRIKTSEGPSGPVWKQRCWVRFGGEVLGVWERASGERASQLF